MKQFPLLVLVLFIYGCKKPDNAALNDTSYTDYLMADSLSVQHNDSAFYYYNKVANNSSNRLNKAGAYNRMAAMQFNSGDHFNSQATATASLKLLDGKIKTDLPYLLADYNLLGRSFIEQKNYDAAITYLKEAEQFQEKGKINPTLLNNLGVAYQKKKDYSEAKSLFQSTIDSSKQDTLIYAIALSNLARTKWLENPSYDAAPELLNALRLREIQNKRDELKTSYSHLADYYFTCLPDSSLLYAKKMYKVAQNPNDVLDAIEKIIRVGSPENAKEYFNIYYKLNDSLKQAHNISRNQYAVVQFDTEKNKADNLRLQREAIKQRVYSYAIIISSIILLGLGIVLYRRRKRRIEQESQDQIREHQLKTSKKVHDVVANGLYRIMTDLEHRDKIDKEPLLDKIEILYERSRDISYDKPVNQIDEYCLQIHGLLNSFGKAAKILIVGNQESTWNKLSTNQKTELEYILQELMVNMSKHSHAHNVVVKFAKEDSFINIHYKDDGVGISTPIKFGNGLRNTENRIKNLGGTIIFDGVTGLKIEISLPIGNVND